MPALEERGAQMLLEAADAVADRGGSDAELPAGEHEALVARGGLEEAQAFQWRQLQHGEGPEMAL